MKKIDVVETFLENYPVKVTRYCYKMQLNNFFKALKIKDYNNYFSSKRDYDQDILDYQNTMSNKPPKSIKLAVSVVRNFFLANNVELQPKTKFALKKRRKGSRAWTQDEIFTPNELKKILQHGNAKSRALFLFCATSGCRIGEVLKIQLEDINMDYDPVKINIRGEYTKTGESRIVFINNEAKQVLQSWLLERNDWLKRCSDAINNSKKFKFKKDSKDNRVFPISYEDVKELWVYLVKKAGFDQRDPRTKRRKYHVHGLRKYFSSRIGINSDITEALLGHEEGVKTIYKRYRIEQIAEFYKSGMYNLNVFERIPDLTDINAKLIEKDKQIQKMNEDMKLLKLYMQGLENKYEIEKLKNGKK